MTTKDLEKLLRRALLTIEWNEALIRDIRGQIAADENRGFGDVRFQDLQDILGGNRILPGSFSGSFADIPLEGEVAEEIKEFLGKYKWPTPAT